MHTLFGVARQYRNIVEKGTYRKYIRMLFIISIFRNKVFHQYHTIVFIIESKDIEINRVHNFNSDEHPDLILYFSKRPPLNRRKKWQRSLFCSKF